jgi:hypothetical protein
MDGLLKQATSHILDAAGVAINKNLLRDMLKSLPSGYLRDKKQMAFLTSVHAELDYRNRLADRATVGGDRFIEEDTPALYSGVPVKPVPLFPENLGQASRASSSSPRSSMRRETSTGPTRSARRHTGSWRSSAVSA